MESYSKSKALSEEKLTELRAAAKTAFSVSPDLIVGVNGSLARREFTSGSDLDIFYLSLRDERDIQEDMYKFNTVAKDMGFKMPAAGGVFDAPLPASSLISNIGGQDDTNKTITRRMLFLLEGDWIFNEEKLQETRANVIAAYAHDRLRDDQICLFLLNDIIRYWRTICIDFEFKAKGGEKAKAIRLIKLRFSRMLIYIAGVLAVADTHQKPVLEKRKCLVKHFGQSPIERIRAIAGAAANNVLERYDRFLGQIDTPVIREQLNIVGTAGEETAEFKELDLYAHEFRDAVAKMVSDTFEISHPIHKALMY